MNSDSIDEVQSKIAYLERSVAELSDVVFRQHKEIQVLVVQLKSISERLQGFQSEELRTEQERPPHY